MSLNKLFVGPAGTITRLHYDAKDAHGWLAQARSLLEFSTSSITPIISNGMSAKKLLAI